jgi:hypothetical protein
MRILAIIATAGILLLAASAARDWHTLATAQAAHLHHLDSDWRH